LNLDPCKHTISMSGPGQRSTFQVSDVTLSIWLSRPTRRRTAVESTAAMACLMREAAVDRGRRVADYSHAAVMCAGSKISVARSADIIDVSVSHPEAGCGRGFENMEGSLQNWRVGIRATYKIVCVSDLE
jgi:hypothetical protein